MEPASGSRENSTVDGAAVLKVIINREGRIAGKQAARKHPQRPAAPDLRKVGAKELRAILEHHLNWISSGRNLGHRALLARTDLSGAILTGAQLDRADLTEANLCRANLRGADLEETTLQGADLRQADLQGAFLQWADVKQCDLRGANLCGAELEEADLRGANLSDARLEGADLEAADLQHANLAGASLQGAEMRWADLNHADLRGANLSDANGLTQAQLDEAFGDEQTRLPAGFSIPSVPHRGGARLVLLTFGERFGHRDGNDG